MSKEINPELQETETVIDDGLSESGDKKEEQQEEAENNEPKQEEDQKGGMLRSFFRWLIKTLTGIDIDKVEEIENSQDGLAKMIDELRQRIDELAKERENADEVSQNQTRPPVSFDWKDFAGEKKLSDGSAEKLAKSLEKLVEGAENGMSDEKRQEALDEVKGVLEEEVKKDPTLLERLGEMMQAVFEKLNEYFVGKDSEKGPEAEQENGKGEEPSPDKDGVSGQEQETSPIKEAVSQVAGAIKENDPNQEGSFEESEVGKTMGNDALKDINRMGSERDSNKSSLMR